MRLQENDRIGKNSSQDVRSSKVPTSDKFNATDCCSTIHASDCKHMGIHLSDGVALLLQFIFHSFLNCFCSWFKQELDLSYCRGIDNIYHLRHLRLLKILKLRGTCVSDTGIASWLLHPSAGNLEELDLSAVTVEESHLITDRTANLLAVRRTRDLCEIDGAADGT